MLNYIDIDVGNPALSSPGAIIRNNYYHIAIFLAILAVIIVTFRITIKAKIS